MEMCNFNILQNTAFHEKLRSQVYTVSSTDGASLLDHRFPTALVTLGAEVALVRRRANGAFTSPFVTAAVRGCDLVKSGFKEELKFVIHTDGSVLRCVCVCGRGVGGVAGWGVFRV